MEYERIHKVQTGIISPSKLRMKLLGPQIKNNGSNCNSSRTSPSRLEDSDFLKNSLLNSTEEEGTSLEVGPVKPNSAASVPDSSQPRELVATATDCNNGDPGLPRARTQPDSASSSSVVHPVRANEEENLDYDSTLSFEFHNGDHRPPHQPTAAAARMLTRPVPSKWNDAEKWIMKRTNSQNQASRPSGGSMVRVAPELAGPESWASVKRIDVFQPVMGPSKFGSEAASTESAADETAAGPVIRSVSMRDMGTEMTPIPSQEPSRSATPAEATTPLRSPPASVPSTPRAPTEYPICNQVPHPTPEKKEFSEQELKLRTRREIVALGVQLGKMNIAAWASKDEKGILGNGNDGGKEAEQLDYEKRAAAWEETEKSKHAARLRREEIRTQAWESRQKARLEAEMRKIEARIEHMRAQAQAKTVKKIAMARQKSEEKRASAEARKNRQAEKIAAQAECIRQTGRVPLSPFYCCGWL